MEYFCLFVSKELLLQLRAVKPLLPLKTWEEQKEHELSQKMSHPTIKEPGLNPVRNDLECAGQWKHQGGHTIVVGRGPL